MQLNFDLSKKEFVIVQSILAEHLPLNCKVWIFGSRAKNKTQDYSDLNLALEGTEKIASEIISKLKQAFKDSLLPYTVDIRDLKSIAESFRKIVDKQKILFPITVKQLVPKLRFGEFEGDWGITNLQDLAIRITEKNSDNKIQKVLTNSATRGVISQDDYFDREIANKNNLDGYYVVNIGDYIYNPRISKFAPVGPIKKNNLVLGLMSPLYSVFRFNTKEDDFFEKYFETMAWHRYMKGIANYGARHDRMNISNSDFFKMPIPLPPLPEQTKIATFLSAVDEKLQQLSKKKALLDDYKKGVMQKIFSQDLRFKDDNGNEFEGDWESRFLNEVSTITTGSTPSTSKKEYYDGQKLFVSPADIKDNRFVVTTKTTLTELGLKNGRILDKGSVLFVCIGSTIGKVAQVFEECISNQQINTLTANSNNSNNFIFSLLSLKAKKIKRLAGVQAVPQLNKTEFSKLKFHFPPLPEQTKIATFLSAVDEKLQQLSKKKALLDDYKKGLLQHMFV